MLVLYPRRLAAQVDEAWVTPSQTGSSQARVKSGLAVIEGK